MCDGETGTTRCPETATAYRHQCIYEQGHDGDHFAKDTYSYFIWPQKPRSRVATLKWLLSRSRSRS